MGFNLNYRQIYGRNSVMEALNSNCNIDRILISNTARNCDQIVKKAKSNGVFVKFVNPFDLKKFENCQGVVAFTSLLRYHTLASVLRCCNQNGKVPFFLICDKIFDPHNLGALIRSAAAAGVDGVVISNRGCSPITEVVEKVSAGAINYTKLVRVSNIAQSIVYLKKRGVFVWCADLTGTSYFEQNFKGAVALVVGSEGRGVSELIKKRCDGSVTIPMADKVNSLNVSVAGGILMFEIAKQNNFFKL